MIELPWLPLYRHEILLAAGAYDLDPKRLIALVWQESQGGASSTGVWGPVRLYRYEPAFWDRYLAGKPEWAPPDGAGPLTREIHRRRVSASYGLCQIMYPTARLFGLDPRLAPEALFEPGLNLLLGAQILVHHRRKAGSWRKAWLRYNGGARKAYADEAEEKFSRVVESLGGGGGTSW